MHSLLPTPLRASAAAATLALFITADADAAIILQYQMGQVQPQTENAVTTADGGNLTPTVGGYDVFDVNANPLNGAASYPSQPVLQVRSVTGTSADANAAFATNRYFTFTLTVGSGVSDLDLTSLTFNVARGGTSSERGYGVRVDTPTTTDQVVQASKAVNAGRPVFQLENLSLTSFGSLQNLTAGQVVNFEVATYTTATGTTLEFDDITVNGDVTVPEPGSALLALVGGMGLLVGRRRR